MNTAATRAMASSIRRTARHSGGTAGFSVVGISILPRQARRGNGIAAAVRHMLQYAQPCAIRLGMKTDGIIGFRATAKLRKALETDAAAEMRTLSNMIVVLLMEARAARASAEAVEALRVARGAPLAGREGE